MVKFKIVFYNFPDGELALWLVAGGLVIPADWSTGCPLQQLETSLSPHIDLRFQVNVNQFDSRGTQALLTE